MIIIIIILLLLNIRCFRLFKTLYKHNFYKCLKLYSQGCLSMLCIFISQYTCEWMKKWNEKVLRSQNHVNYNYFFLCSCSKPDDDCYLAETCGWLCMILKFLCLAWVYCTSDYTRTQWGWITLQLKTTQLCHFKL
jgi:hypothetical protein